MEGCRPHRQRRTPELDSPELYSNRELSWLEFNERVLELAEDERMPLLERVKFLAIYASNLDEFYMVRVAGLHDQVDAGIDARGPTGCRRGETIERIAERARELGERHSRQWEDVVRPAAGGARHPRDRLRPSATAEELEAIDRQFSRADLPGADAAGGRARAAVPVHLEPVAVARRLAARPRVAAPRRSRA